MAVPRCYLMSAVEVWYHRRQRGPKQAVGQTRSETSIGMINSDSIYARTDRRIQNFQTSKSKKGGTLFFDRAILIQSVPATMTISFHIFISLALKTAFNQA